MERMRVQSADACPRAHPAAHLYTCPNSELLTLCLSPGPLSRFSFCRGPGRWAMQRPKLSAGLLWCHLLQAAACGAEGDQYAQMQRALALEASRDSELDHADPTQRRLAQFSSVSYPSSSSAFGPTFGGTFQQQRPTAFKQALDVAGAQSDIAFFSAFQSYSNIRNFLLRLARDYPSLVTMTTVFPSPLSSLPPPSPTPHIGN